MGQVVSHDANFLDQICTDIIHFDEALVIGLLVKGFEFGRIVLIILVFLGCFKVILLFPTLDQTHYKPILYFFKCLQQV